MSLTICWRAYPLANSLKRLFSASGKKCAQHRRQRSILSSNAVAETQFFFDSIALASLRCRAQTIQSVLLSVPSGILRRPRSPWCRSLCVLTFAMRGTPLGEASSRRRGDYSHTATRPRAVLYSRYFIL